jgi:hypothetical protein
MTVMENWMGEVFMYICCVQGDRMSKWKITLKVANTIFRQYYKITFSVEVPPKFGPLL